MMKIEIKDVTSENIDDLVGPGCAPRWEDPRHAQTLKEGGLKKKEWMRKALQKFDCCAKIAYFEGKPIGFIEFYPMQVFPLLPKRQERTVLITCVVVPEKVFQNLFLASENFGTRTASVKTRVSQTPREKAAYLYILFSLQCCL